VEGIVDSFQLDAVVDTAGVSERERDLCLARLRPILPPSVSLRVEDLSILPLSALSLSADFVAVIDASVDVLSPTFESLMAAVRGRPEIDLLYGQEVVGPERIQRHIPGWSPERLRNIDYLPGLVVMSRRISDALEPATSRPPIHRWEMLLRAGELAKHVEHLTMTLTHRRDELLLPGEASAAFERNRLRVLQSHCNRIGLRALAVSGPAAANTRARRVHNQSLQLALILPGPHTGALDRALIDTTCADNVSVIVVCGPNDAQPEDATNITVVNMPHDSADLSERARWGLSTCDAEFVAFAPPHAGALDELWLEHLAGLISHETVAAGPTWVDVPHALERPDVEAEVESLPLAGTVFDRSTALAAFDRMGRRPTHWFEPFLSAGAFGANLVVSPDIRLSMVSSTAGGLDNDTGRASSLRRSRRRVFPLSR
jgi:hypothetical protein